MKEAAMFAWMIAGIIMPLFNILLFIKLEKESSSTCPSPGLVVCGVN